jgi:hypothetical protein
MIQPHLLDILLGIRGFYQDSQALEIFIIFVFEPQCSDLVFNREDTVKYNRIISFRSILHIRAL